jgi:hypothetical protein
MEGVARYSFQKADMGKDGYASFWKCVWQMKPLMRLERIGGQEG